MRERETDRERERERDRERKTERERERETERQRQRQRQTGRQRDTPASVAARRECLQHKPHRAQHVQRGELSHRSHCGARQPRERALRQSSPARKRQELVQATLEDFIQHLSQRVSERDRDTERQRDRQRQRDRETARERESTKLCH